MKKSFCLLTATLLIFLNSCFVLANQPIKGGVKTSLAAYAPQWEEFCPLKYINAQYAPMPAEPKKPKGFKEKFKDAFTCYYFKNLIQYGVDCSAIELQNYWVQRRKAFESEINLCLADESTALACFMQVRQIEDNKTAQRNGLQEQQAQRSQQAAQFAAQQAMQNAQMIQQSLNNMQTQLQAQQMNNNLNNINSSINGANANLNYNLNKTNNNLHEINRSLYKMSH